MALVQKLDCIWRRKRRAKCQLRCEKMKTTLLIKCKPISLIIVHTKFAAQTFVRTFTFPPVMCIETVHTPYVSVCLFMYHNIHSYERVRLRVCTCVCNVVSAIFCSFQWKLQWLESLKKTINFNQTILPRNSPSPIPSTRVEKR